MMKNKTFIIINIFGMGVAIAICIVSYLAYEYDHDFDAVHKNGESIYRINSVREFDKKETKFGYAPLALAEVIDKTFANVDQSSVLLRSNSNFRADDNLFAGNLWYVDPDFFNMFSFNFIAGGPSSFDNTAVLLSETMAKRLFGSAQAAFNKTITQVAGKELRELKVTGIFRDPPSNSSFHRMEGSGYLNAASYKYEFGIRPDDWRKETTLFVQISERSQVAAVDQHIQQYRKNNNEVREDFQITKFTLEQLTSMAHRDRDHQVQASTWPAPPVSAIVGSAIMSVLILLIACFNLTNTAIAISSRRLKEIGIRKVMGSTRKQLILQFIGETTVICFLSLIVGLAISDPMTEGWNLLTNNNIHLDLKFTSSPGFLSFLAGLLLFTGVIAGSYPAFYLSKFKPISILKGKLLLGGTNHFTRILLGLQFTISLIAIVAAIGFLQNAQYQHKYDLGFNVHKTILVRVNDQTEFDTYRNALQENASDLSIAGARGGIFAEQTHEPVKHESLEADVDVIEVGDNYLNTMGLQLQEGRNFSPESQTDKDQSIIITQKMAELFGWNQPIGKEIIWRDSLKLYVIGVVKDVYARGLWQEMQPMMIRYVLPDNYNQMVVSADNMDVASLDLLMKEKWSKIFPGRLYDGYYLGSVIEQVETLGMSIVYGYTFLGAIAMLLSITGLYTLLSLNIAKRTKEIGIRKIVGASVMQITRVVNTEFAIILAVAATLGSWAGFNWCNIIMSTIWKYYQGVNAWTFVYAISVVFAIAVLTIAYKIFAIAKLNPVVTLRDE